MTAGQRKRRQRNLAIAASVRGGLSFHKVAAVHGLSVSRVKAIYDELEDEVAEKSERLKIPRNSQFSRN